MTDWQPILTAPKDGTIILFYCGLCGRGDTQLGIWWSGIGNSEGHWETLDGLALEGPHHPTHWMPLPEPPQ